jgi:arylsulfatase A-like enzyme
MRRAVIVVCDSLRADLITPATTPTLAELSTRVSVFAGCTGVFPSVTRVTSACISTGCYPGSHGLLGNTVVLDEGDGLVCLSVGAPDFKERMRRATGRTLRRPTLAERLAAHGGSVVMSNVSPGAAYFQDPDGYGFVYHRAGSYGPGRAPVDDPLTIGLGEAGDAAMTERFCDEVLRRRRPALGVLWLSEPDNTGHKSPLGSPEHLRAIAAADRCVARVLETIAADGNDTLLVVCSDHGMETTGRTIPLTRLLVAAGLKAGPDSRDVVVAPNGTAGLVYRSASAKATADDLARFLRDQEWVSRVFTGDDLARVGLPAAELAAAITLRTEDRVNAFGIRGYGDIVEDIDGKDYTGFGQHGGFGPNEQKPFLFIQGGGFKPGRRDDSVSHVDIAPTILRHLDRPHEGTDGRPLHERARDRRP